MTTAEASRTTLPGLYALLLGLAGRIPDDALAEMRFCLADAETAGVAAGLAAQVGTGRLALTEPEAASVRTLFEECDLDPGVTACAPRGESPPPYRFGDEYGDAMPDGDGGESQKDAMDAVAVEAGVPARPRGPGAARVPGRGGGDGGPRRAGRGDAVRARRGER